MGILHLANIFFEWEFARPFKLELKKSFYLHPHFLQLQFLPLLFADQKDGVAVTHFPPSAYLKSLERLGLKLPAIHLIDDPPRCYERVESWGWSQTIKKWADSHGIAYNPPPFQAIAPLASKEFAFSYGPSLPGSRVLHDLSEVNDWLKKGYFPKVLKKCYAFSGRGHFILKHPTCFSKVKANIIKTFRDGHVLIGEPWVTRTRDFSTQWELKTNLPPNYLGATIINNTKNGCFNSASTVGIKQLTPFLELHLNTVKQTVNHVLGSDYYGYLGIDAMVYENPTSKEKKLHPIVEINLRKTMGWLMLELKKRVPLKTLTYKGKDAHGLLPCFLKLENNKTVTFTKQLQFE